MPHGRTVVSGTAATITAHDGDPRVERSRTRLLDAAEALLRAGGMSAVTVEAVTRRSTVARTTLYRHFHDVDQLRTATLERMLPTPPKPPAEGSIRDRLVELLTQYATAIAETPAYLTTLAWLADDADTSTSRRVRDSLRRRFLDNCVEPFAELLGNARTSAAAPRDEDVALVMSRLLGPVVFIVLVGIGVVFIVLVGIGTVDRATCTRFVDDYLAARAPHLAPPA